jgi:hypothetical protein
MANKNNGEASRAPGQMALPLGMDAWMEFNRPALAALAQVNGRLCDGFVALNKNWTAFVNRRLQEELAMPQHLAGCKTVQDLYGVYNEFFQTACADYQAEFERLAKLAKTMADETIQAVQTGVEEAARSAVDYTRSKAA